jgi:uncharacterized membrane protein
MKDNKSKLAKIILAAMFAALTCVATMFFMVPLPGNGYANFGDCFVIVGGLVLGPVYGVIAAAVGSAISDIFLGYAAYAPATFVIKGLMALAAFGIFSLAKSRLSKQIISVILAALTAEIAMVLGYFLFEIPLYGLQTAMVDIVGNSVQGIVGMVSGVIVYVAADKVGVFKRRIH